jgi:cephalosporin hydroxylase
MITIDGDRLTVSENGRSDEYNLGSPEAFSILSRLWLRSGWDTKYVYSFTWLGRPIIQLPEDMMRIQELIYSVRADVIIETGIAHGGSLIFYASLCKAMGRGRVVGIDVEIRPQNRKAIEGHSLFPFITLIEGSSIEPSIVNEVAAQVRPGERTIVLLDSCHTKEHVLEELNAYSPLVSLGSYIVAMDGIMEHVVGAPRTAPDWKWNNPRQAALDFVAANPEFIIEEPPFLFNEGSITERVTYWPSAFIKRVRTNESERGKSQASSAAPAGP